MFPHLRQVINVSSAYVLFDSRMSAIDGPRLNSYNSLVPAFTVNFLNIRTPKKKCCNHSKI